MRARGELLHALLDAESDVGTIRRRAAGAGVNLDVVSAVVVIRSPDRALMAAHAELHIHANTLYARLERISELLGPTWRDPDRLLEIQLALRVRGLITRT